MSRRIALLAFLLVSFVAGSSRAEYQIDAVHSTLIYRIKHMGFSYSYGRFNNFVGKFTFDPAAPEKSTFEASVKVDDIDSGNAQRDGHLKSPDFFNAKQYPTIKFKSTSVKKVGDDKLEVTGDLTLHGVTKPVTATLTVVGSGKGMAGETRAGFDGTIELKRSDFGMDKMLPAVGDEVRLIVSIEGAQK